jgi:hypothetical protein
MRLSMQFLILAVVCWTAAPAGGQVPEAETQAALAALEHLRPQFPFPEVVLGSTRDAEGRQTTAFTDALARAGRIPVETPDTPVLVCDDRCTQTREASRVSVVPVERDGVLHVRSGRGRATAMPAAPSGGITLRAGSGPAATIMAGVVGTHPLGPRLRLRAEALKSFQGIETCQDQFPDSHRCRSSPLMGVVGLSYHRPADLWSFGLGAGAGVHLEDEEFGGAAPMLQLRGGLERVLGDAWVGEATVLWAQVFNATWEEQIGEPLGYFLVGMELRRRWRR